MKKLLLIATILTASGCVPDAPTASIYDTAYAGGPVIATPEDSTTINLVTGPQAADTTIRFAWDQEWNLGIGYQFQLGTDSTFTNEEQILVDRRVGREVELPHSLFFIDQHYYWRVTRINYDSDEGGENGIKEIWNERSFVTE